MHNQINIKGKLGRLGRSSRASLRPRHNIMYRMMHNAYSISIGCAFALLLLGGICINPTGLSNSMNGGVGSNGSAYAEEGISTQADGMSVSLTMDGDVNTLTDNSKAGQVNYISSGFTVTTANVDGYNVYVQTAPGSTNKLTNGSLTVDFVKVDTPTSEFTDNTWGYAVDSTGAKPENLKYNPVPDSATTALNPAYSSTSTGETRNFTINFATKFGANATPGHYTTGILLSAVAGAEEVVEFPGFNSITYMQDMNPTVCANAAIGETKQLIDTRDLKKYWVTKLKDNNCWMTQNLDLDIPATGLETGDTDLTANWNSDSTTKPVATQATDAGPSGFRGTNTVASYDPGIKYCSENTTDQCNLTSSNNNGHDAVGNYYSWMAAAAGTGVGKDNDGDIAPSSICPKGWKLPLSGSSNSTVSGSFKYLVDAYSIGNNVAGSTTIKAAPLYFVYGGVAYDSSLDRVGSHGYCWSSTAASATYTYYLSFASNFVNPSDKYYRVSGYSVRCVAR